MTTNKYNAVSPSYIDDARKRLSPRQHKKLCRHTEAIITRAGDGGVNVVVDFGTLTPSEAQFTPCVPERRLSPWQPFSYVVRQERGKRAGTHN